MRRQRDVMRAASSTVFQAGPLSTRMDEAEAPSTLRNPNDTRSAYILFRYKRNHIPLHSNDLRFFLYG